MSPSITIAHNLIISNGLEHVVSPTFFPRAGQGPWLSIKALVRPRISDRRTVPFFPNSVRCKINSDFTFAAVGNVEANVKRQ